MKKVLTKHNDYFDGKTDNDWLNGWDGDDYLAGNAGNDTLLGGQGDDELRGGVGKDILLGSDGDDLLDGGIGADKMTGGDGDDYYIIDDSGDQIIEQAYDGNDTVETRIDFILPEHIESLTLIGNADISGSGNNLDNYLFGNATNNTLSGLFGNDRINGLEGDDSLDGGKGNDWLHGDLGDWHEDYNPADGGNDTVDGGIGNDTLIGGEATDLLIGGNGNDELIGDFYHWDEVDYEGNPRTGANDNLYGGEGSDYLYGGFGDDVLHGDNGDDDLLGGMGSDTLDGGAGEDWFYYDTQDKFSGGADIDTIWAVDGQPIDLATLVMTDSYDIEVFDLRDFSLTAGYAQDVATTMRLSGDDVIALNARHEITVTASSLDTVKLVGAWHQHDSSTNYGYDDYMFDHSLGTTALIHVSTEALVTIIGA